MFFAINIRSRVMVRNDRGNLLYCFLMEQFVICTDINNNTHEVLVSELVFRPAIYGVVVKGGKVLLHQYAEGYGFPGGGIEIGETLDEAFSREIKEETGLHVQRGESLKVLSDFFIHPGTKKPYHTILLYFSGVDPVGEISTNYFDELENSIAKEAVWVDIENVASLKFFNPMSSEENQKLIQKAVSMS